jgi:hypothetical protein
MFANSSYYKQTLEKVGARNVSVQLLPFLHLIKTNVRLTFSRPAGFSSIVIISIAIISTAANDVLNPFNCGNLSGYPNNRADQPSRQRSNQQASEYHGTGRSR